MQILYELLQIAEKEPINKTRLMYKTNLSYTHFIKYLDYMVENEFLIETQGNPVGTKYFVGEKGKKYLDSFKNVLDFFD
jgi:predicted transcriptional regulator